MESVDEALLAGIMRLVPLAFAVSAALTRSEPGSSVRASFRQARAAALVGFAASIVACAACALFGSRVFGAASAPMQAGGVLRFGVRMDALSCSMLLLVSFLGIVIVRYSRRYMDGDPQVTRYLRWIQATLASVCLLVATNDLLVLALAWIATSLSLHQLLTHFSTRPAALIAAHKKFIASRAAEVCVLAATLLIGRRVGSFELDALFEHVASTPALSRDLEIAAALLAIAAALKCAQMPFHGWLIQVMEAPTTVSALLHAGVVNIGGFLMIRLAPLISEAEGAQLLLVAWGGINAVVAALVMTTRVSIKVSLAWSTCAQMGFMLLECGLGAYSLALLHLLAHSLYKAHAFLSAGSIVEQWRVTAFLRRPAPTPLSRWFGVVPCVALAVIPVALVGRLDPRTEPALWALGPIFVCAMVPFAVRASADGALRFAVALGGCAAIAGVYVVGHGVFARLVDPPLPIGEGMRLRIALALACFASLFVLQGLIAARPDGALVRALYPRLFAGLYLDDLFTRLTFRIWPARAGRAEGDDAHAELRN